jgi:type I restriction enzyme R subunit
MVNLFSEEKAVIVKVERDGLPDVEAFKRRISSMIEEAIIKEDEAVSKMSRKEKSLLSEENIEKFLSMKRKNIAA